MKQKRKKLIIDKKFQGSFIGISLAFAVMAIVLNYLAMWFVFKSGVMFKTPLNQLTETGEDIQWMIHVYFLINILMFILFMLWAGVVMTNQVAGPLYRLRNHMKHIMKNSEVEPFIERKGDLYFRPLLHTYNEFLEWIRNKS